MRKAPTPTESKKERNSTKQPQQKPSIAQRFGTDFGRSVGVTIAT